VKTIWAIFPFSLLRRRAERRAALAREAAAWKAEHGERAYGRAREQVIAALIAGDREAAERWGALRFAVGRLEKRYRY